MDVSRPVTGSVLPRTGRITRGPLKFDYYEHVALRPRQTVADVAATTQAGSAASNPPNLTLALLQTVLGYEWLVSGADKLLDGSFPDQLGGIVTQLASGDRLPALFAAFLRTVVAPNAYAFGLAVEFGETLAGLGLLMGALLSLVAPALASRLRGSAANICRGAVGALSLLSRGAALATIGMGINYFLLDGLPTPWFSPGFAFGGALDTGLLLALAGVVILFGQTTSRVWRSGRPH